MENTKKPKHKKAAITLLVSIIVLLVFFAGMGSGMLQYTMASIGCMRAPVTASRFMASNTYELPGEEGYGPDIFSEYYCTEQQAKAAGFRHSPLTGEARVEAESQRQKWEEEKHFSPEKVDFKVYIPGSDGYTIGKAEISSMSATNKQVFFPIKKDGYRVANAREGRVPNDYELCTGAQDSCEIVGTDIAGRQIKKQTANRDIISYGTSIGDTFINLEAVSSELTIQDVLTIFGSMTEYKNE